MRFPSGEYTGVTLLPVLSVNCCGGSPSCDDRVWCTPKLE